MVETLILREKNKKIPHFYGAVSRLGTRNNPNGTHESNEGVEGAYNSIVGGLYDRLTKPGMSVTLNAYPFSNPSNVSEGDYFPTIAKESQEFTELICGSLKPNEIAVTIGGDHSVSFPAINAWLKKIKEIGGSPLVIQGDSHMDACLNSETPSGNFQGMWMRPYYGFDIDCINKLVEGLPNSSWLYIGDLENEPYWDEDIESAFIKDNNIGHISKEMIARGESKDYLQSYLDKASHVYYTGDIDQFTNKVAPATGISGEWGLTRGEVFPLLEQIAESNKLSGCDLVEINPKKEGAKKTIELGQSVLETLLL
tara:strand:- start:547 stop:1479 length:933 start_codon:yes stop_codon:yes gene_type:complete